MIHTELINELECTKGKKTVAKQRAKCRQDAVSLGCINCVKDISSKVVTESGEVKEEQVLTLLLLFWLCTGR